jgi:hypothetical protein
MRGQVGAIRFTPALENSRFEGTASFVPPDDHWAFPVSGMDRVA